MILSLIRQSAINYLCALENRKLIKLIIFYIRKYMFPYLSKFKIKSLKNYVPNSTCKNIFLNCAANFSLKVYIFCHVMQVCTYLSYYGQLHRISPYFLLPLLFHFLIHFFLNSFCFICQRMIVVLVLIAKQ